MGAAISFETLVNICQTTRGHIPDNINLCGNKLPSSIKDREFLDNMSDYQLRECFTSWTWFLNCTVPCVCVCVRACVRACVCHAFLWACRLRTESLGVISFCSVVWYFCTEDRSTCLFRTSVQGTEKDNVNSNASELHFRGIRFGSGRNTNYPNRGF
jgi:hypothetical protein